MRASALLFCLGLAGCFYLEVINVAPVAQIRRTDTNPNQINKTIHLTAQDSRDDDGDTLTFLWVTTQCATCPLITGSDMQFVVPIQRHDPVAVSLTVTDQHGARSAAATQQYIVADTAPTVLLTRQGMLNPDGSYTLAHPIDFRAAGTDLDGDSLTYHFSVERPPQSDPEKFVQTQVDATNLRIVPDAPGRYEVTVTVDDGYDLQGIDRVTVEVGVDQPPCVAATSPSWSPESKVIVFRADGPRRFAVESVTDDLDSFPGGDIEFRWLVSAPGEPLAEVPGHDLPDLLLDPTGLDPGDLLDVRVEIADRETRTLPCGFDQAACSIGGNSCFQRLTWTVEIR